jgi:uncharacterized protein YuzE
MKYEYSPEVDILLIRLQKGKLDHGEQHGNVIFHYSKEGKLLELEILDASQETAQMIHTIMKSKQSVAADSN